MSQFSDLWNEHKRQMDYHMGETVIVTHVVRGQFLGISADPDIPAFNAVCIPIIEDVRSMSQAADAGVADRTTIIMGAPEFTFRPDQFGPGRPIVVDGTRLTRPNGDVFEISSILMDSVGQIVCRSNQVLAGSV